MDPRCCHSIPRYQPSGLLPVQDHSHRPPAPAVSPVPPPAPGREARGHPEAFGPPRAEPLFRPCAGWHPPRAPRTRSCRVATRRAPPPLRSRRCAREPRARGGASRAHSRRGRSPGTFGSFALLHALFRHFVEEGHHLVGQVGRHARHLVDFFTLEIENVLQRLLARLLEHGHELGRETLHLGERDLRDRLVGRRQRREQRAFAAALQPLAARVEIDLPAGELGGEPHVLAVATDRERQLVFVHDRLNRLRFGVGEHARHARRRERQLREALGVGRPGHDVDALAVQLVHDSLHARALQPDARADGIDAVITRPHRDLGAAARFARRRADFDDLLLDLGDLELEERFHEQRVSARQDQARPLRRLLDPFQDGADRVALMEVLAVILVAVRDDRFGFTELVEHDDDLAALDLLDFAREQLADLARELFADAGALAFAHALDDALLGRLHRRAAELLERHLFLEHVAGLEVRVFVTRFFERDLRAGVFDRFDHRLQHDDANRSFHLVDADLGPHVGPVALHERRVQTVLQEVDELRALELLGVGQLANCGDDVSSICHYTSLSLARRASFTSENRYSCSAPPSGSSTTLSEVGTATMRARTRPRPASYRARSPPTNRSKGRSQRTGRSIPGLDTSKTYLSPRGPPASSHASRARLTRLQSSTVMVRGGQSMRTWTSGRFGVPPMRRSAKSNPNAPSRVRKASTRLSVSMKKKRGPNFARCTWGM